MADLEITANELGTIDTNQISQITLKDGTLIMVNGGAEQAQPEEEFVQEEQAQEEQVQEEQAQEVPAEEGQENQLRHRPMMPMMILARCSNRMFDGTSSWRYTLTGHLYASES